MWPASKCFLWTQAALSISTRNLLCFSFPVILLCICCCIHSSCIPAGSWICMSNMLADMHPAATRACLYFLILFSPQYQTCWLFFLMMKSYFFDGISFLFNKVMKWSHWLNEKTQNQQAYGESNIYVIKHYNIYACASTHKHIG